jgi:hypothetical protein
VNLLRPRHGGHQRQQRSPGHVSRQVLDRLKKIVCKKN